MADAMGFIPGVSTTGSLTVQDEMIPTIRAQANTNTPAVVLKVRGGSDTYMRPDGKVGTAGKGALASEDLAFTAAATQDQTLFAPSSVDFRHGTVGGDTDATNTLAAKSTGGYSLNYQPGVMEQDGPRYVVRRLTPMECERLQGFPSIVTLEVEKMTADELIACALANGDITCDFERGVILGNRGPGGMKLSTPRVLGFKHPTGYIHVNLSSRGIKKQVRAHRIIYMAAHGSIPDGMVIDHINGVKDDNRLCNLQALTAEDNSHKAKDDGAYEWISDPEQNKRMVPYEIRDEIVYFHRHGMSYQQLAEKYGCSKTTIGNIVREEGWTKVPYRGKPAEQCPDGPRYKALGNSFAVPVVRWIFERMQAYDLMRETEVRP